MDDAVIRGRLALGHGRGKRPLVPDDAALSPIGGGELATGDRAPRESVRRAGGAFSPRPIMTAPQAFALALQHHQASRLQEAEALYREVLAVQPEHVDALQNLGVIA